MIDKIKCKRKIGCDIHRQLIALLKHIQIRVDDLPERIMEEEYFAVRGNKDHYPDWYVGLAGFCASFGSNYFGGYARNHRRDNSGDFSAGAIKCLKKQAAQLKDVVFYNERFQDLPLDKIKGYVIYCDIPYRGTTRYKVEPFPYEEFYEWAKTASLNNTVLISEYAMPSEFECIWEKETKVLINSTRGKTSEKDIRVEKLYTYIH